MDFLHEAVEMDSPFGIGRGRCIEQVHRHRLAAPHAAPDIEALKGRFFLRGLRPKAEEAAGGGRIAFVRALTEPQPENLKLFQRDLL